MVLNSILLVLLVALVVVSCKGGGGDDAQEMLSTTKQDVVHGKETTTTTTRPIVLTDLTFDSLVNGTSDWMINLHSPWCPACQEMKPVWERLAHKAQGYYQVGTINVQEEKILLHRFQVTVLPTVMYVSQDGTVYEYKGALSVNSMHRFAMKQQTGTRGGDSTPRLEGCSSPVSTCGRILGRIMTAPTWIKKTFIGLRSDFEYGDVALIALILGGPVVMGLVCICLLDAYVVHSVQQRPHRD